jgi:hypothetical protein
MIAASHNAGRGQEDTMFWTGFDATGNVQGAWAKVWKDQLERLETMGKEIERVEQQSFEKATEVVDESARLAKETFAYGHKLGAEWRKASLEAARKTAELFGARA